MAYFSAAEGACWLERKSDSNNALAEFTKEGADRVTKPTAVVGSWVSEELRDSKPVVCSES
jgi:hypothetical protein